jgi:hypothetical protein
MKAKVMGFVVAAVLLVLSTVAIAQTNCRYIWVCDGTNCRYIYVCD